MKRISAICPTHNRPKFLMKSIECFLAQTYEEKELIVIDTGDSPMTWPSDPQVKRIVPTQALTIGEKYRYGMAMSSGDYFAIWDDDDWNGPRRLERSIDQLESLQVDAVGTTPVLVLTPSAQFALWKPSVIEFWQKDPGASWLPCSDNSLVWRRSASQHDDRFSTTMQMFKRMHEAGAKFAHIMNEGFFVYVRHPNAAWSETWSRLTDPIPTPRWVPQAMINFWKSNPE